MASSNNPRKFSEKIALHNQKQAEETAAFEEVMKDLNVTRAARVRSCTPRLFTSRCLAPSEASDGSSGTLENAGTLASVHINVLGLRSGILHRHTLVLSLRDARVRSLCRDSS